MKFYCEAEVLCFDNDNAALIPQIWAIEALRVLKSNMVMGALVNVDYSDEVKDHGDVVNTSRPADFVGKRKTDTGNIVLQDAKSVNIPVPLDQHIHVAFTIKDGERSKSLPDLVARYLEPAAREMSEKVDQVLCGQAVRLSANNVGRLGELDKTTASDFMLAAHTKMQVLKAPKQGRNLVVGPRAEGSILGSDIVSNADKRGDEGTSLREASIGRVYGFDTFMDQNMSYVDIAKADFSTGVTSGAESAGATVIETDVPFVDVVVGQYVTIEDEGNPHRVASVVDNAGDATITLTSGLKNASASGSVVNVYSPGASTANYAAAESEEVVIDGSNPGTEIQVGQWVTFGTGVSSHSYTVISAEVTVAGTTTVLLDRPLSAAVANNDPCYVGPAGGYNLAFHRDALALVTRPLASVPGEHGASSFVASFEGLSMRVTMQYDITSGGTIVNFDLLCGVAVLDDRLATVVLS